MSCLKAVSTIHPGIQVGMWIHRAARLSMSSHGYGGMSVKGSGWPQSVGLDSLLNQGAGERHASYSAALLWERTLGLSDILGHRLGAPV
jgi:hypothetical protein